MEIAFKRRNIFNASEIVLSFLQNLGNDRIFGTGLLLSTPKTGVHCIGRINAMEIAFKRRNISNKSEITLSFLKIEQMDAFFAQVCFTRR